MRRKGSFIPPAPPTPLGAYSHIMNATAPLASLGLAAGGTAAGLMAGNPAAAAAMGAMGGAAPAAMMAPVTAAAMGEKGMTQPPSVGGPAAMALLMRSMGSKIDKPEEPKKATAVTAPTHGMSAGQMNSYVDQVKQEQSALDGGAPAPDYSPASPAPRTTPIANTPQQPDEAMKPSARSIAEQRHRQRYGGM